MIRKSGCHIVPSQKCEKLIGNEKSEAQPVPEKCFWPFQSDAESQVVMLYQSNDVRSYEEQEVRSSARDDIVRNENSQTHKT